MSVVLRILLGLLILAYVCAWTGFAVIMVFSMESPKNWIGWWVLVGNPFLLAVIAGLIARKRRKNHA